MKAGSLSPGDNEDRGTEGAIRALSKPPHMQDSDALSAESAPGERLGDGVP